MAGPISTLNGSMSINLAATCTRTDPLIGALTLSPGLAVVGGFTQSGTPPAGSRTANQYKYFTVSVPVGPTGNTVVDLFAASANVLGDLTATFGKITGLALLLPTITQMPSLNLTVQSSGVTVGNSGASANPLFLTTGAMSFELKPGRCVAMEDAGASFVTVTALLKDLKILNNDAANIATVVVILMGTDT